MSSEALFEVIPDPEVPVQETSETPPSPPPQSEKPFTQPILTITCALLAGTIALGIFAWAYRGIDPNLFLNRDDGIITASHARNWVEFGSIGVNPSGERVEGFSSPLQFLFFALAYAVSGVHYATYFVGVAAIAIFLLGMMLYALCLPRRLLGILGTAAGAWLLTRDASFLEWHASGMENPLTHVFFLLSVIVLARMLVTGRIRLIYALPILAASFARIESICHIGPLLVLFTVCWWHIYRRPGGFVFAVLLAGLWSGLFLVRYAYFGEVFPNTATAQSISITKRLLLTVTGDVPYWRTSFALVRKLFLMHHGWMLLSALACLPLMKRNRRTVPAFLFLFSLALTGLLSPFLFGEARLDPTRLSTHVALAVTGMLLLVIIHCRRWAYRMIIVPVIALSAALMIANNPFPPYYLWFSEKVFEPYRQEIARLGTVYDIPRPTIANPDLGLMSWDKQFNIVDLGMLGSPPLSRLSDPRDIANYLLDIAAPDIIELHGIWSARYAYLFKDARFIAQYEPAQAFVDGYLQKLMGRSKPFEMMYGPYVRAGYWVRRDVMKGSTSRERRFLDAVRQTPSVALFQEEMARCRQEKLWGRDTFYVLRTAYRFLPEFRKAGNADSLLSLFANEKGALAITDAPLRGAISSSWGEDLTEFVLHYRNVQISRAMMDTRERLFGAGSAEPAKTAQTISDRLILTNYAFEPVDDERMNVHLVILCTAPLPAGMQIYMHGLVPPAAIPELPGDRQAFGFLNWDIGIPNPPSEEWHEFRRVVLTTEVRHWKNVNAVRLGFNNPGTGLAGAELLLPVTAAVESP